MAGYDPQRPRRDPGGPDAKTPVDALIDLSSPVSPPAVERPAPADTAGTAGSTGMVEAPAPVGSSAVPPAAGPKHSVASSTRKVLIGVGAVAAVAVALGMVLAVLRRRRR